mgnify:CR=1 FL=1
MFAKKFFLGFLIVFFVFVAVAAEAKQVYTCFGITTRTPIKEWREFTDSEAYTTHQFALAWDVSEVTLVGVEPGPGWKITVAESEKDTGFYILYLEAIRSGALPDKDGFGRYLILKVKIKVVGSPIVFRVDWEGNDIVEYQIRNIDLSKILRPRLAPGNSTTGGKATTTWGAVKQ